MFLFLIPTFYIYIQQNNIKYIFIFSIIGACFFLFLKSSHTACPIILIFLY
uniref:Candidate secreted effector n=1 Tax=Meloidogyne incognita TaxID=6306 RepID=A0A914KGB3_MELIC